MHNPRLEDNLTPQQLDRIVQLRDRQGLDFKVIAERYGIGKNSAARLYRARKATLETAR